MFAGSSDMNRADLPKAMIPSKGCSEACDADPECGSINIVDNLPESENCYLSGYNAGSDNFSITTYNSSKPKPKLARTIRITGTQPGYLQIAEVEVFTVGGENVALKATASSSSVIAGDLVPSRVINGDKAGIYPNVFSTVNVPNPTLVLDLNADYNINKIVMHYRSGGGILYSQQTQPLIEVLDITGTVIFKTRLSVSGQREEIPITTALEQQSKR
jgi:hypothetical protein